MTIKQVIIGSVIGATAIGAMIHRLPKSNVQIVTRSSSKPTHLSKTPKKQAAERLSLSKVFG